MRLLATTVLIASLSGCQVIERMLETSLPPAVQQQLDDHDKAMEVYDDAIKRTEAEVKAALEAAKDAAASSDWAAAQTAMSQIDALELQHSKLVESYNKQAEQARNILKAGVAPATHGLFAVLDPLVPIPLQPLVPLASSLLVMLGSSRSRKHAKRALRHVLVGQLGDGVRDVLKAVGAAHSSAASKQAAEEGEAPKPAPADPSV